MSLGWITVIFIQAYSKAYNDMIYNLIGTVWFKTFT
jgi:hypothetical protein